MEREKYISPVVLDNKKGMYKWTIKDYKKYLRERNFDLNFDKSNRRFQTLTYILWHIGREEDITKEELLQAKEDFIRIYRELQKNMQHVGINAAQRIEDFYNQYVVPIGMSPELIVTDPKMQMILYGDDNPANPRPPRPKVSLHKMSLESTVTEGYDDAADRLEEEEKEDEEEEEQEGEFIPEILEDEVIERALLLKRQLSKKKQVFLIPYLQKRNRSGIAQSTHLHAIGNLILAKLRDRGIIRYNELPGHRTTDTEILSSFDDWIAEQFGGEEVLLALHDLADDEIIGNTVENEEQIEMLMLQRLALEELHTEKEAAHFAKVARDERQRKRDQEKKAQEAKAFKIAKERAEKKRIAAEARLAGLLENPDITSQELQELANEAVQLREQLLQQQGQSVQNIPNYTPNTVNLPVQKLIDIVNMKKYLQYVNDSNTGVAQEVLQFNRQMIASITTLQKQAVMSNIISQVHEEIIDEELQNYIENTERILESQMNILDQQFLLIESLDIPKKLDDSLQNAYTHYEGENVSFFTANTEVVDMDISFGTDGPGFISAIQSPGYSSSGTTPLKRAQSRQATPTQTPIQTPAQSPRRSPQFTTPFGGNKRIGDPQTVIRNPTFISPEPRPPTKRSLESMQSTQTNTTTSELAVNTSFEQENEKDAEILRLRQELEKTKKELEEYKKRFENVSAHLAVAQAAIITLKEKAAAPSEFVQLLTDLDKQFELERKELEDMIHKLHFKNIEMQKQMQQMTPRKAAATLRSIGLSARSTPVKITASASTSPRGTPVKATFSAGTSPMGTPTKVSNVKVGEAPVVATKIKKRVAFRVEERAPKDIGANAVKRRMDEIKRAADESNADKQMIEELKEQITNLELLLDAPSPPNDIIEEYEATIEFLNGMLALEDPEKEEMAEWIYYARIEFGELQYKVFDLTHTLLTQHAPRAPEGIGDDQINEPLMADEDEDTMKLFMQGTQSAGGQVQALTEIPKPFFGNPTVPDPLRRPEISGNAPGELPGAVDLNPIDDETRAFGEGLRYQRAKKLTFTDDAESQDQPYMTPTIDPKGPEASYLKFVRSANWKPNISKELLARYEEDLSKKSQVVSTGTSPMPSSGVERYPRASSNLQSIGTSPFASPAVRRSSFTPSSQSESELREQLAAAEALATDLYNQAAEKDLELLRAKQRISTLQQQVRNASVDSDARFDQMQADLARARTIARQTQEENTRIRLEAERANAQAVALDAHLQMRMQELRFNQRTYEQTQELLFAERDEKRELERRLTLALRALELAEEQLNRLTGQGTQLPGTIQNNNPGNDMATGTRSTQSMQGSFQAGNIAPAGGGFIARGINPNVQGFGPGGGLPGGRGPFGGGGGGGGGGLPSASQMAIFAPNRAIVRDEREYGNQSRFAREVSRFFESEPVGEANEDYNFNDVETFELAMQKLNIEYVDLTSDTSLLKQVLQYFYRGDDTQGTVDALIKSGRKEGSWPLKYKPKYADNNLVSGRSVTFLNRTQGQVVNSDVGTIFVGGAPSASIRRQGLNYVVSGPRGEKAVFGTARDAQYYSSSKGKRYGPVTESVFGYKPKNLSQAIY